MQTTLTVCNECGWPAIEALGVCVRCDAPLRSADDIVIESDRRSEPPVIIPGPDIEIIRQIAGQMPPMEIMSEQHRRAQLTRRRRVTTPRRQSPLCRLRVKVAGLLVVLFAGAIAFELHSTSEVNHVGAATAAGELPWRQVATAGNVFRLELPGEVRGTGGGSSSENGKAITSEIPGGVTFKAWSLTSQVSEAGGPAELVADMAAERNLSIASTSVSSPSAAGVGVDAELSGGTRRTLVRVLVAGPVTMVVEVSGPAADPRLSGLFDYVADSIRR